jgi:hypothetical protein
MRLYARGSGATFSGWRKRGLKMRRKIFILTALLFIGGIGAGLVISRGISACCHHEAGAGTGAH